MQQLIYQFRLHLLLSRVHPCLLFITVLLHLTGSRTRGKWPCSFSFLVYSCAVTNSGEHQSVKLEFCISDMLSADYHGISTNVKDSCFNSEFSNSYRTKAQRVSILKKKEKENEKQSYAAVVRVQKNASLFIFFFSWSTFCMTHKPGSKMAFKQACIILHIQVSAYTVLLNIPEVLALLLGRGGEGMEEFIPRRALTCVSIAPWWPYPTGVYQSNTSIPAACSAPQVGAGLLSLENVCLLGFFGGVLLFISSYERHSLWKKTWAFWVPAIL